MIGAKAETLVYLPDFQRHNQRAVAAHGVSADGAAIADVKLVTESVPEAHHADSHTYENALPRLLGGIEVKSGP